MRTDCSLIRHNLFIHWRLEIKAIHLCIHLLNICSPIKIMIKIKILIEIMRFRYTSDRQPTKTTTQGTDKQLILKSHYFLEINLKDFLIIFI